uniref:SCP domain-containing protein n=1 Tax=Mesocestoides corti TaxID=53468 RepID=A0A5K3FQ00_MESCO
MQAMLKLLFLFALICSVVADVPSEEERRVIMECHTKLREGVQPTASNMQLLNYSREMEQLAEKFVNGCNPVFPSSQPEYANAGYIQPPSSNQKLEYQDVLCKVDNSSYNYRNNTCLDNCYEYKQASKFLISSLQSN